MDKAAQTNHRKRLVNPSIIISNSHSRSPTVRY